MVEEQKQQALAEKLKEMPAHVADKAINALGGFASGFLSGYEAARAELAKEKSA